MAICWKVIKQIQRIAAWFSQGINVIFLGGHQNQTVSARCYMNRDRYPYDKAHCFINRIFFFQDDHCQQSHLQDVYWAEQICGMSREGDPKKLRREYKDARRKSKSSRP